MHANVDQHEIDKFESVASRWGILKVNLNLHRINPPRLNYIQERADGLFGKKVLIDDVGCGGGIFIWKVWPVFGTEVTGLDMGKEPLEVARLHSLETGIPVTYIQDTVENHAARISTTL